MWREMTSGPRVSGGPFGQSVTVCEPERGTTLRANLGIPVPERVISNALAVKRGIGRSQ